MDWQSAGSLAILIFGILLAALRAERRMRKVIVLVLPVPAFTLLIRWADYRQKWTELIIAVVLALCGSVLWWLLKGRNLPPPNSEIRVWDRNDPP